MPHVSATAVPSVPVRMSGCATGRSDGTHAARVMLTMLPEVVRTYAGKRD